MYAAYAAVAARAESACFAVASRLLWLTSWRATEDTMPPSHLQTWNASFPREAILPSCTRAINGAREVHPHIGPKAQQCPPAPLLWRTLKCATLSGHPLALQALLNQHNAVAHRGARHHALLHLLLQPRVPTAHTAKGSAER